MPSGVTVYPVTYGGGGGVAATIDGPFRAYSLRDWDIRAVAPAADGAVWVVSGGPVNYLTLMRVTPGGVVALWVLKQMAASPEWLTVAADGSVWFSTAINQVVHFATNSSHDGWDMTTYRTSATPLGVTAASDGGVWFAERASQQAVADSLGSIDVNNRYSEYPLPSVGPRAACGWQCPTAIAVGPEGTYWFTEGDGPTGSGIGRVRKGAYDHFPVAGGAPYDLVTGLDGAIWFTDRRTNQLGRLASDGSLSRVTVDGSSSSGLNRLAAAPDGSIWVTYGGGPGSPSGQLAHVRPGTAPQLVSLPKNIVGQGIAVTADRVWIAAGSSLVEYQPPG